MVRRELVVLGYHRVEPPRADGWDSWFSITEETFLLQLAVLRGRGFVPIDREAFLRGLDDPATLPERPALLTFDDGYRSLLDVAVPALLRAALPAIVFVSTGFVGGANDWEEGSEPPAAICDWEDLRALERCGVAVESHGVRHLALSRLRPGGIERELRESKAALESALERPVELFAYPYGAAGRAGRLSPVLEAAGYRAAFLYGGGPARLPPGDRFRISRLAMGPDTDLSNELRRLA
jgi:peptidoglycan/xylan/chitin deacetylase (PgdA/CDA1 family)